MSSPFYPAVNPPQDLPSTAIGSLLARVRNLEAVVADIGDPEYDIKVFQDGVFTVVGDGAFKFMISTDMGGATLIDAAAYVGAVDDADTVIQIENNTAAVAMLSTPITIDAGENSSYAFAPPAVVDTPNATVAAGDMIWVDVDAAGSTGTGLGVILTFKLPPV